MCTCWQFYHACKYVLCLSLSILTVVSIFLFFWKIIAATNQSVDYLVLRFRLFSNFNKVPILKWIGINSSGSVIIIAVAMAFCHIYDNLEQLSLPLIALQSEEKRTLPLIISAMGSSHTPDCGMMMTAAVLATLPTALIFFLMQKQFVAGMTGSVKG